MIELRIEDVEILDNIILELCQKSNPYIDSEYLRNNWIKGFNEKYLLSDQDELIRLSSIIESFDCAEINNAPFSTYFIKRNSKTLQFKQQGGFRNEFKKQHVKSLREKKQDEILDLDVTLKRFESKIGKKLILFGAIISFLSFLITVLTLEFWQTDESKNEQKNQVENPLLNKKEEKQKDTLN